MPVSAVFQRTLTERQVDGSSDVTVTQVLNARTKRWEDWLRGRLRDDETDLVQICAAVDAVIVEESIGMRWRDDQAVRVVSNRVVSAQPLPLFVDRGDSMAPTKNAFINPVFAPKVGVVDSGISPRAVWKNVASATFDVSGKTTAQQPDDTNGHGTAVAAIVAHSVRGVAPGVELAVANVATAGEYRLCSILAALCWLAGTERCDIVNCSWGQVGDVDLWWPFVNVGRLGVTVVAATGDYGANNVASPAAYGCCIGVGCSDPADRFAAPYSAWSVNKPDLCALGLSVPTVDLRGQFVTATGSSFAAPLVSGAAARLMQSGLVKQRTPKALRRELISRSWSTPLGAEPGRMTCSLDLSLLPDRC